MLDRVELDISRTILDTAEDVSVNAIVGLWHASYSLLIDPFTAIEANALHKPAMEDLEMHRRPSERSEAEIPCPRNHLCEAPP